MMKQAYMAAAVAAAFATFGAQAQDYQMEGGLQYAHVDADGSTDSIYGADFTFHLKQVSTSGRPLAEAAFLGRSSNLGLSYATVDKADVDALNGSGEFYFGDFYGAVDVTQASIGSDDSTDFAIRAGFLPMDGLLLTVGYEDYDLADLTAISLGAKYVVLLNDGMALNLEGDVKQYDDQDDTIEYTLLADYYLNNALSFGVRFNDSDASGSDATVGVGAKYFFTPVISGEIEYANQDKTDTIGVRVAMRF